MSTASRLRVWDDDHGYTSNERTFLTVRQRAVVSVPKDANWTARRIDGVEVEDGDEVIVEMRLGITMQPVFHIVERIPRAFRSYEGDIT